MNLKEFREKYNMTRGQALKQMQYYGISKENIYKIPDDLVPVYILDKRKYRNSKVKGYLCVMDAISKGFIVDATLIEINDDILHTIVMELRDNGLIRLINGRARNSFDPRDYIVTLNSDDWFKKESNEKEKILGMIIEKGAKGLAEALIPNANRI